MKKQPNLLFHGNRPYASKIKLAEFGIKKSGSKSYLKNPKGKPGNPRV